MLNNSTYTTVRSSGKIVADVCGRGGDKKLDITVHDLLTILVLNAICKNSFESFGFLLKFMKRN